MAESSGNSGIAFIVGGLLVVVVIIAVVMLSGGFGGFGGGSSKSVNVKVDAPTISAPKTP